MALINPRQVEIGNNCFIRDGARFEVVNRPNQKPGSLRIGNNVTIEQNVHIIACDSVVIEDEVCITPRCTIVDATHPVGTSNSGNRGRILSDEPTFVKISRRVFLGANVVILPNVTIGENSIIGAGSVVSHDIPPNCVAAGSPAKVIRVFDGDGLSLRNSI
ncbi:acyltransferase [Arthrobacter sp. MMS18-M83]|uniref:acyltransferase n=1 Tax=Arthrobacter sp. MMS18-M83 TaxID=2996261 RepID=UPI002DD45091|nr:acyltransferase [Arthrobacter sp. MMS18-M83]